MDVLLFGVTRDIVGKGNLSLPPSESVRLNTVADLKGHLVGKYPGLRNLGSLAVAVNQMYAKDDDPIGETDEIALIPPVSGG